MAALLNDVADDLAPDNHSEPAAGFDPNYSTLPLDEFVRAVRAVFGRTPTGWGAE